jgi:hypothetical protein
MNRSEVYPTFDWRGGGGEKRLMARALRIEFPGAWHPVRTRRSERRIIFRSDADRNRLRESANREPYKMTN